MHTSVRYVDGNVEKEDEPCLWVKNSFPDLIPFPYAVDDAGLVACKASNPENLLLLRQEKSVHRGVGEKDEGKNGP